MALIWKMVSQLIEVMLLLAAIWGIIPFVYTCCIFQIFIVCLYQNLCDGLFNNYKCATINNVNIAIVKAAIWVRFCNASSISLKFNQATQSTLSKVSCLSEQISNCRAKLVSAASQRNCSDCFGGRKWTFHLEEAEKRCESQSVLESLQACAYHLSSNNPFNRNPGFNLFSSKEEVDILFISGTERHLSVGLFLLGHNLNQLFCTKARVF